MTSENQSQTCSALTQLFTTYAERPKPPILELQDISHKPVGALYLETFKYKKFVISETNNSERFYLYVDGLGVYFSFFRQINQS